MRELYLIEYRVQGRVAGPLSENTIHAPSCEHAALVWCRWWDETMCDESSQLLSAPELPHVRRDARQVLVDVSRPDTGEHWLVAVETWIEPRYEVASSVV